MTATARNPRPSTAINTRDAVDVDVTVTIGDYVLEGEVTLAPSEYDGQLGSWGQPDHWVSGGLLAALRRFDGAVYREALNGIEKAARQAAAR